MSFVPNRVGQVRSTSRSVDTHRSARQNESALADDAASLLVPDQIEQAALGDELMQIAGGRLRSRRYSSAFILAHDADSLIGDLADQTVQSVTDEPQSLLDLAMALFDDPSDVYASLDALKDMEGLDLYADLIEQAQSELCQLNSPRSILAGLDAASLARTFAEHAGITASQLRELYRAFVLSDASAFTTFGTWIRRYDRARRRVLMSFFSEMLASEICLTDPACLQREAQRLVALLREFERLYGAEAAFVDALASGVARSKSSAAPVPDDAPLSVLFVLVLEGSLTAEAALEWVIDLARQSAAEQIGIAACLHRAVCLLQPSLFSREGYREKLIDAITSAMETQRHDSPAARRAACQGGFA